MSILLSFGFEGGEEWAGPFLPPPPPQTIVGQIRKMFCGQMGLEVADQFYFLNKY